MNETITLQQYADKVGYKGFNESTTLSDIQEFCQDELDWTLWDYPLEEYDYVLNEVHEGNIDMIVLVNTDIGIRICEC